MAESRNNQKKKPQKSESRLSGGVLFWLAFFILIICLFFINRNLIRTTIQNTRFLERLFDRPQDTAETIPPEDAVIEEVLPESDFEEEEVSRSAPAVTVPAEEKPAITPQAAPAPPPSGEPLGARPEAARQDRPMYFMQVDKDGTVMRMRVSRALAVSDTPMTDVLQALLAGPSPEEQRRGMISFIPPGTKLLSVMVRGTTAYINFNQEFQFSTFGVEGYAAQLRQIVWTATEFSTVTDVQILIEGKRVDYLGESILIGGPISRDMLP
jgi:spore germination protein GerM